MKLLAHHPLVGPGTLGRLAPIIVRLARDESGGETLEYSIVAGLIVVAAIGLIKSVGTRVLARWSSLNASL